MPHFEWDPALETGNADIDAQHRHLFALANALQSAIERGRTDSEMIAEALYGLTDYVLEHFADEEALMDACAYPQENWHKTLHRDLTAETLRLTSRFMNDRDVKPDELAPFLVEWLQTHIRREDMRLVEYQREREGRAT